MEKLKGIGLDPRILEWADKLYKEQEPYHRPQKGGTGLVSYTAGDLIYASDKYALSKLGIGSTGQVLKVAGGVPTWAAEGYTTLTRCKVTQSAGQAIGSGSWVQLTFDTETYDVGGFHSTSSNTNRLTMPEDGVYIISAAIYTSTATSGALSVTLNNTGGAGVIAQQSFDAGSQTYRAVLSFTDAFSANDWISSEVFLANAVNSSSATFFSAVKIGV